MKEKKEKEGKNVDIDLKLRSKWRIREFGIVFIVGVIKIRMSCDLIDG